MKRLLLSLSVSMLLLIAIGAVLIHVDFEARFFSHTAAVSEQWEQQLRKEGKSPLIVFGGGSEIRANINPEDFQQRYDMDVVNAGQHAGFGLVCNIISALPRLQAGDTFVVSVINSREICDDLPLLGVRYLWRREGIRALWSPLFPLTAGNILKGVRFNQQWDWVYFEKLYNGDSAHWYETHAHVHPSGWMEIYDRKDLVANSQKKLNLPKTDYKPVLHFLKNLQEYCDARGVKLICYLPWRRCSDAEEEWIRQLDNIRFLQLATREHIHFLKDEHLGCTTDASLFADTHFHLNQEGVARNTENLGASLRTHSFWTAEELAAQLNTLNNAPAAP